MSFNTTHSVETIVKVYQMKQQGISISRIERELGLKNTVGNFMYKNIEKVLAGKHSDQISRNYKEAASIIWSMQKANTNQEPLQTNGHAKIELDNNAPKTQDRYQELDQAFATWQQALINFVEDEAKRRSEQKVAEIKEKYEKELQKMQAILVEAKESSVVGVLRKHFGN